MFRKQSSQPMQAPWRAHLGASFSSQAQLQARLGLQVLGLTSYSHWAEAGALRACARASPAVRARLLSVALGRLESMVHVGLMEQLDLSVASLAVRRHSPHPSQLTAHLLADCARRVAAPWRSWNAAECV